MSAPFDLAEPAIANKPALQAGMKNDPNDPILEKHESEVLEKQESITSVDKSLVGPNGEQYPSDEDWTTLRRVYG
jgi:proton-dependent oligopeptide transporter, POT family